MVVQMGSSSFHWQEKRKWETKEDDNCGGNIAGRHCWRLSPALSPVFFSPNWPPSVLTICIANWPPPPHISNCAAGAGGVGGGGVGQLITHLARNTVSSGGGGAIHYRSSSLSVLDIFSVFLFSHTTHTLFALHAQFGGPMANAAAVIAAKRHCSRRQVEVIRAATTTTTTACPVIKSPNAKTASQLRLCILCKRRRGRHRRPSVRHWKKGIN